MVAVGMARGGDHVPLVHHDVVALKKASAAGIDDDYVGSLFIERRLDLGTPDAVTHYVQSRFIGGPQDKPADLAHLATDLAGAVAPASAHDGDAMDVGTRLYGAHVTESMPNQACGIGRLTQNENVYRQQLRGQRVEVVVMKMRDEHGVNTCQDLLSRNRQFDKWVPPRVGGVAYRVDCTGRIQHGVNQKAPAGEFDEQGGVADQTKQHRPMILGPLVAGARACKPT